MNGQYYYIDSDYKLANYIRVVNQMYLENGRLVGTASKKELRRNAQNALGFHWYKELEQQGDMTAIEYRAKCKLHFGVPILKEQEPDQAARIDKIFESLNYEQKIEVMLEPFDFPITRLLSVKNYSRYLREIELYAGKKGFRLTTGFDLYVQAMGSDL